MLVKICEGIWIDAFEIERVSVGKAGGELYVTTKRGEAHVVHCTEPSALYEVVESLGKKINNCRRRYRGTMSTERYTPPQERETAHSRVAGQDGAVAEDATLRGAEKT